jgi:pimeloyl-ACP methyl ester carboxylesterase
MPHLVRDGATLHWEVQGSGEPVLMIMGLSFTLDMWYRLRPAIASRYRAILFDNRGVGRSDTPRGPYSMCQMAEDARAVLDAAGVESAYVMGASMGGMIAQELYFRHPDRVRALLLGCSGPSGLRSSLPEFRRVRAMRLAGRITREEREWLVVPMLYADDTPRDRIAEDIQVRLQHKLRRSGVLSQLAAIVTWSSYSRLPLIRVPTLVLHGDQDYVVPLRNGRLLAERIPGAELVVVPGAGHVMTTDAPEFVEQETLRFLEKLSRANAVKVGTAS